MRVSSYSRNVLRIVICILFLSGCLYSYLDVQNAITDLRIQIPRLTNEVRRIEEENTQFKFQIEKFESPENLMQIAKMSEFSHLKFPVCRDVLTLRQDNLITSKEEKVILRKAKPTITFATNLTGANSN